MTNDNPTPTNREAYGKGYDDGYRLGKATAQAQADTRYDKGYKDGLSEGLERQRDTEAKRDTGNLTLPTLPPEYCWRVLCVIYGGGHRWVLELYDHLEARVVLSHGWRTGYTVYPEQIEGRAQRLMSDFVLLGKGRGGKLVPVVQFTEGFDPEAPEVMPKRYGHHYDRNQRPQHTGHGPRDKW